MRADSAPALPYARCGNCVRVLTALLVSRADVAAQPEPAAAGGGEVRSARGAASRAASPVCLNRVPLR